MGKSLGHLELQYQEGRRTKCRKPWKERRKRQNNTMDTKQAIHPIGLSMGASPCQTENTSTARAASQKRRQEEDDNARKDWLWESIALRGHRYYLLLNSRTSKTSARKGRRYYPPGQIDCITHTSGKQETPHQNNANTQMPSALQGGPEQPRGFPLRSRSFSHGCLNEAADGKRAAAKRGLRSNAATVQRRTDRSQRTKPNRQPFREFKKETSKHCVALAPRNV